MKAYVTRDKNGTIKVWRTLPYRRNDFWHGDNLYGEYSSSLFPNIKWENEPFVVNLME